MKQGAGNTGGDGDQIALSAEDSYLARSGKLGEIHRASIANAGCSHLVGRDRRQVRQKLARMNEEAFQRFNGNVSALAVFWRPFGTRGQECPRHSVERVCVGDGELGGGGAAERFQMGATAQSWPISCAIDRI